MKTLIIIIMTCLPYISFSQVFSFSYDNAGNRIQRTVLLSTKTETDDLNDIDEEIIENEKQETETDGELDIKVFPNPTFGSVSVDIINAYPFSGYYKLIDNTGKEIESSSVFATSLIIDLTDRLPGIYFLKLNINDQIKSVKIIKE